ncbi:M16 family metallopeptidase [Chryseosolibacter indicus]|uniref:Insulinase family protein n=1 Tax=Chryseosolibacter indicus TaxID=2782351 RepID=A0ABS5VKN1_9BACT|nr:pitrilysin family protein [Chryseosolibacter indicus]MBT1702002.1 insulinase family protein [Chryseosolibacter indicus]
MLDRKTPPPFARSTSFDLLKPVKKTLPNGIDIFFISGGEQEVIKVELIFKAGRWFEKYTGCSHFASNLLNKGTNKKGSFEIAQIFDRYGAHLEIHPGLDFVSISIYGLTQYLAPVLDLLVEIITEPSYPEKELSQNKAIFNQNLKVNLEKTSFIASKAFRKTVFGESHPYGREIEENDVNSLTRAQLTEHYQTFFKNISIFVSGKISEESTSLIESKFATFVTKAEEKTEHVVTSVSPFRQHIEKEGSLQSSLRVGCKAIQRSHPDYASAVFVSHIIGGYFGSRLMKNIREEKGLTYGIYCSLQPFQKESSIVVGADVNKENVSLAFDEIRKEFKRMRENSISTSELNTARNHFIGSLQSEITTSFAHADKIKTIYLSNLPNNYYQQMIHSIESIDALKIMEISENYFNENNFHEIAAG